MKILIAEDEDILCRVLEEKFEDENFKVITASTGDVVIDLARKNKPDMILLDILMPKLNGIEVLAKLKKDDSLKSIPVIMISNLNEDQKIEEALRLGAVDYLVKTDHPIKEVIEKVNKYIIKAK